MGDALKAAQQKKLLFCEYEAALHLQKYVAADTGEARAQAEALVADTRARLHGPAAALDALAAVVLNKDARYTREAQISELTPLLARLLHPSE